MPDMVIFSFICSPFAQFAEIREKELNSAAVFVTRALAQNLADYFEKMRILLALLVGIANPVMFCFFMLVMSRRSTRLTGLTWGARPESRKH